MSEKVNEIDLDNLSHAELLELRNRINNRLPLRGLSSDEWMRKTHIPTRKEWLNRPWGENY